MKSIKYFSFFIPALFTLGCGGNGGLDDGQQGPVKTIPQEVVLQSNTNACPPSPGVTVFAFGGTPPYTLRNPVSDYVSIDRTRIDGAGQGVLITFLGGCLEKIPLIFVDRTGATATVDINYKAKISP